MIYLVSFGISVFFAYVAYRAKKGPVFIFFSVLSILTTVMLAGLRDYDIGTDVKNYMNMPQFWAGAISADSLFAYMRYYFSLKLKEPLFALFVGIIARTTGEFRVFLFLSHAVIVTGAYVGAFRLKQYARPEITLLLFYLMYYNNSLNIIRQYMAMAIVFAFFADIEQRKFLKYGIAVLVASLIHTTALISVIPMVIYLLIYPQEKRYPTVGFRAAWLSILIIIGVLFVVPLIKQVIEWGILSKKYSFYLQGEKTRQAITRLLLRFLEVIGLFLCYRNLKNLNKHLEFYLVNTAAFLALLQISTSIVYGQRIPAHFSFVNIVTVAMLEKCHKKASVRMIWAGMIIILVTFYWYHTYVLGGGSETIPYQFGI